MAGRPKKILDVTKLRGLAAIHCTIEEIAAVLECSKSHIEKSIEYMAIVNDGKREGAASLRRMQWAKAKDGNPTMLIWLGKQLLGQKDIVRQEHTGAEGGPISVEELDGLRDKLAERIARATQSGSDQKDPEELH